MVSDDLDAHPPSALPRGYARDEHVEPRPVWVSLPAIYPTATTSRSGSEHAAGFTGAEGNVPVPAGQHGRLDLSAEVMGRLHHWERDLEGRWFGLVDYSVPFVGDFRPCKHVDYGLVPAAALRPRELQAPDGHARHAP